MQTVAGEDRQFVPRRLAAGRVRLGLAAVLAFALVLLAHGFAPGLVNTGAWNYLLEGDMRCLDRMGWGALTSWCDSYGEPLGYPFLSSGPIVFLGWAFMELTGVGSYTAYVLAGAVFDAVALAGGYGLLRMLGARPSIALVGAAAYLISPTVIGMRFFGGTFTGIAVLPAIALADLLLIRAFELRGRNTVVLAVAGYTAVKTLALFMDGYCFVMSVLLTAGLWLAHLARRKLSMRSRVVQAAPVLAAHLVAVAVFTLYSPAFQSTSPVGFFRAMGLDVSTLVFPTQFVWWADLAGIASTHADLWGDGTNSAYNYLGVVCAVLAAVAVATRWRDQRVLALGAVGVASLVLAVGPSLKVNDVRGPVVAQPGVEAEALPQSYFMPTGVATVDLPWSRVYSAPALETMRATYRWSAVTRLALILLAALAIERLVRQPRRRLVGGALAVLAIVEIAPNVPDLVSEYRDNHRSRSGLRADVLPDLDAATEPKQVVFFLSPDGVYNDYLVNYLAPSVNVTALNAGGDKNEELARASWPPAVSKMAGRTVRGDDVVRALQSGDVDVVIAPNFNLQWAAYAWPPPASTREAARERFAPLRADRRLATRSYPWFTTMRLRGLSGRPASP